MSLRNTLEIVQWEAYLTQGLTTSLTELPTEDQLEMKKELHLSIGDANVKNSIFAQGSLIQVEATRPPPHKGSKPASLSRPTSSRVADNMVIQKSGFEDSATPGADLIHLVERIPQIHEAQGNNTNQAVDPKENENPARKLHAENVYISNLLKSIFSSCPDHILSSEDRGTLREYTQAVSTSNYN